MKDRYGLIQRGLFPETLPPCFTSNSLKRGFSGLVKTLKERQFRNRPAAFIPYNGTKHDGSRRYFGSPNPISYFYVSSFIADHWSAFEERLRSTPFSVSQPKIGAEYEDRSIIIPSLSELTTVASKKLGHCRHILRADIAQFYPSIYTHAISWSAHGITAAKDDQDIKSAALVFNKLDFFVRACQKGESRGFIVGPDAFRIVAEYIASGIDKELSSKISTKSVGAARHVDDYFIGVSSQQEADLVLADLRDTLQTYNLNINDAKTKILLGTEPLNELWAQELRRDSRHIASRPFTTMGIDDTIVLMNKCLALAENLSSASPVKMALRLLDQIKIYDHDAGWEIVEPYIQRIMLRYPHCIDYSVLLAVKRVSIGKKINALGWKDVAYDLIDHNLPLNHHHEIVWLCWLLIGGKIEITDQLATALSGNSNSHIKSLVVAAFTSGIISRKPPIRLGAKLGTTDDNWLLNLVSRAQGYTKAPFSGLLTEEFEHLADKKTKLIDFNAYQRAPKRSRGHAISLTRYGYDREYYRNSYDDDDDDFDLDDELDEGFRRALARDNT